MTNEELLKLRKERGPDSKIGHRCSNVLEMRLANASQAAIDKQLGEIRQLLSEAGDQ